MRDHTPFPHLPTKIALVYALIGGGYIVFSDGLLAMFVQDIDSYQALQTYKGWAYIAATAVALWFVLRTAWTRINRGLLEAEGAEQRLRLALTAAKGAVWTAAPRRGTGAVISAEGGLLEVLGFQPNKDDYAEELCQKIHPDDRSDFDRIIENFSSGAVSEGSFVCRIQSRDLTYRWIKIVPDVASFSSDVSSNLMGVAFDVTDLREATRQLSDVIAGGELGTWRVNLHNRTIQINERWAELIGFTKEELQVTIEQWRALVHPDDLLALDARDAERLSRREYFLTDEFRMCHKDGSWVWVQSRGRVVESDELGEPVILSGVHVDITVRKKLEEELTNERDFLRQLTDTSISGILAVDHQGILRFANPEAERILGASATELIGRKHDDAAWQVFHQSGRPLQEGEFPFSVARATGQEVRDMRLVYRHPDGDDRIISVNVAPPERGRRDLPMVCTVTDITRQVLNEQDLSRSASEATYASLHDAMTGLPNRLLFEDYLEHAIRAATADGTRLMQIFVDVDNFKMVNDRYGHPAGDKLIAEVAKRLSSLGNDAEIVARVGGDEFALLYKLSEMELPQQRLGRLSSAFDEPFSLPASTVHMTASMGTSLFPMDAESGDELWINSDLAMYEAKLSGRNQVVQFSDQIGLRVAAEAEVSQRLQLALRNRQFEILLQPQVALDNPDRTVGAEVLVRCTEPALSHLGTAGFIPIAERSGSIRQLDLLVVEMVGKVTHARGHRGLPFPLSFNLSPESLKQEGFGDAFLTAVTMAGLSHNDLKIELTEGAIMADRENVRENLGKLIVAVSNWQLTTSDRLLIPGSAACLELLGTQDRSKLHRQNR